MTETSDLLRATAESLFAEQCAKNVLLDAEKGIWPTRLWAAVEAAGLPLAMVPEAAGGSSLPAVEALTALRVAARFAAPVPLGETMLAARLAVAAGLFLPEGAISLAPVNARDTLQLEKRGTGWHLSGRVARVPWGRHVKVILLSAEHDGAAMLVLADRAAARIAPGANLALEPRDELSFDGALVADRVAPAPFGFATFHAMGAALRTVQIAGALEQVLDLTVRYAQDRVQFGRPIGKFQAIQHNCAILAGQTATAVAAADVAAEELDGDCNPFVVGAAKARAGEAAGIGAAVAHQIHGAIGFTQEHMLHFSTKRLWAWRDEFGSEAHWNRIVGEIASRAGPAELWDLITAA